MPSPRYDEIRTPGTGRVLDAGQTLALLRHPGKVQGVENLDAVLIRELTRLLRHAVKRRQEGSVCASRNPCAKHFSHYRRTCDSHGCLEPEYWSKRFLHLLSGGNIQHLARLTFEVALLRLDLR